MSVLTKLQNEVKQVGLVTLYFFICFGIILTLKKLMLASYHIEFYALSTAVIGALIAGKIVVVLDHTGMGARFDAVHSLGGAALYKTVMYSFVTFLVLLTEKMFHAYREIGVLKGAFLEVWSHQDGNIILAKVLCISLVFLIYHLYRGIDRKLGEGTLLRMVFNRP